MLAFLAILCVGSFTQAQTTYSDTGSPNPIPTGNITTDAIFDIANTATYSGVISGSGYVSKIGDGTLTLSGDNTYTGETTVSKGTLTLTSINGTKGTLATGSTVTVDGATSVLAGHGDILGYSSGSVGAINLQNGGTFYNDSTGNHITVGAAINMNNGVISSVENANGNGTFGNFVFDNAINVLSGTNNAITAKIITLRQYTGTSDEEVGGKITVANGAKLTISSQIAAHNSSKQVPLVKLGAGELVLSGDNTFTTGVFVNAGKLTLTKVGQKGTLAKGSSVTVDGSNNSMATLAGHGDILGYSSDTVGTVTLQNGGTLYNDATATQKAHITIGAVLNLNGGFVTAVPDAHGNDSYGNYLFDNAINVTGKTDNEISAYRISFRQYQNTPGNGGGKITVADGAKLTISSIITGSVVPLIKLGTGELVLSGDNTYTKETFVNAGTLTLTYINGTKGTLATGSTVTVDGATSVLAGHGDILGYSSGTVGTVNLQNGGKLYNDSTGNHITVGAAINMNNGYISAVSGAQGSSNYGNFIFDNAINVTGGTNNEIDAYRIALRQYNGTPGDGAGKINVADGTKLTISSIISGNNVTLKKLGEGELVLTAANTYTKGTTISDGILKLTGAGTLGTDAVTNSGTLEFNNSTATITPNISGAGDILVSAGMATLSGAVTQTGGATTLADGTTLNIGNASTLYNLAVVDENASATLNITGNLTLNNSDLTKFIGSITAPVVTKTGLDTLQLCFDAENAVNLGSLVISSGPVDLKGYMSGGITVDSGAVFSPGNSIGEAKYGGGYELKEGATLLLEVGKNDQGDILTDTLTYVPNLTEPKDTVFEDGSIIKIALDSSYENAFEDGDVAEIQLPAGIKGSDGDALNLNNLVLQLGMFELVGYDSDSGVLSVRLSAPAAGVPEPSTWALLLLGAAGLLYVRKRTRK